MIVSKPLILFIDAYDSFSSNIISLLETSLSCTVRTIKIDNVLLSNPDLLHEELRHYTAVVCGPGPGHPGNKNDVGIMQRVWRLCEEETLPVLGICLGFQSLCLEFGGEVRRLREPMHGIVRRVRHIGDTAEGKETIFGGVGDVATTLYHSLCVDIKQESVPCDVWNTAKWRVPASAPDLIPLAWVEAEEGWSDERILVAVQHRTKPFWGLQYHPESICTNVESNQVIKNWFKHAQKWNKTTRKHKISVEGRLQGELATRESLLSQYEQLQALNNANNDTPGLVSGPSSRIKFLDEGHSCVYTSRTIDLPSGFSAAKFMELNGDRNADHILLESTNAHVKFTGSVDVRGRYSIIGMNMKECSRIEYHVGDNYLTVVQQLPLHSEKKRSDKISLQPYGGIWQFMSHYVSERQIGNVNAESPFCGGFIGYTTYEMGLEGIDVEPGARNKSRPDLCFSWVTQSVVIDHLKGKMCIQMLEGAGKRDPNRWVDEIARKLNEEFIGTRYSLYSECPHPLTKFSNVSIQRPRDYDYEVNVSRCQDFIRSGDSYELCLTDQTTVTLPRVDPFSYATGSQSNPDNNHQDCNGITEPHHTSSWSLYKTLRLRQPAPFASYLRLGAATLVSSSPERFLTWDNRTGKCSLRPMKGTVKKSSVVTTLEQASALLQVPKEQAENLMIVDLVRHDLHSVLGSGNVNVPRLMVVEEYASVFQMISIVEGHIPAALPYPQENMEESEVVDAMKRRYTGIDVLAASLPPGSMTGAPKKRSCEILRGIENGKDRSMYSGVVGYMDVGGRGDFSVSIRCMFRWDDEGQDEGNEVWHIGAGGAVTALSTPVGEREEMLTKLAGTLGVFG